MSKPQPTSMSYADRVALARSFHASLVAGEWSALRAILAPDARWILPGDNTISGPIEGPDAILAHLQQIAAHGVRFTLEHILVSRTDVALALHNTAERQGRTLDQHLTTVLRVEDGKIRLIETFLSDIEGMNTFFA